MLLFLPLGGWAQYTLHIQPVDRDSVFVRTKLGLTTSFRSREACTDYIYNLLTLLQAKGYFTASVDSVNYGVGSATLRLFVGHAWRWAAIDTRRVDPTLLAAVAWNPRNFSHRVLDFRQFQARQQLMLDYLENNGYPFAKVSLDSITLRDSGEVSAMLKVDKGPLYKIDSIRVYGSAKISNAFLQRYLNIPNGSIYRKERLGMISKKLLELPYIQEQQPWNITMLAEGSVINLYLKPKKSSQINALVGFLPSSDPTLGNKILVTGEATIDLRNALGNGETMALNWQQLQSASPRLDLVFNQPYLFQSPFGINTSFDLYKQDSSYINVNLMAGAQYTLSSNQSGSVFIQEASSSLLNVDTLEIIASHTLPQMADINAVSLGVTYDFNNTNYRFNPRKGNELSFLGSVGTKRVKENALIAQLKDPNDTSFHFASLYDTVRLHSYEFLLKLSAAHYFPLTRASTIKLGFNGGVFSSPNTYRNELFLIGGYRLLRGFDEQSILASQYTVGTLEYRYLVGLNSFLFTFLDVGWAKNNVPGYKLNNTFIGSGLGMAFETKAGIFNISYALGKRNDTNFNFYDAKIHLGYVSFFYRVTLYFCTGMMRTLLVFFCLMTLIRVEAQTDTTRPPAGQRDSVIPQLTHADSVRRDSLVRVRRARRDSLRLVRLAAQRDSVATAKRDSVAAARRDSVGTAQRDSAAAVGAARKKDSPASVAPPAVAAPAVAAPPEAASPAAAVVREGPPALSFWQKVLAMNPGFNFTGKPVVEIFEIHRSNSKDSLFYLLVGILFYFALVRIFFEKYFNNLMTLFFRVSLRQQQIREQVLQTPLPSLLLNILFIISGGLFACYLLHYSRIGEGIRFWVLYLYCMAMLSVIYLVKFVVLKFVGWVFSISRATDIYIFVVFLVNKMLGIFLLPFLILITFSGQAAREIFITISLAMVFVLWAYRALAAYRPVRNEIKLSPFYFFLYLCAFEIAPLLLIYKVLLTYLEKVY